MEKSLIKPNKYEINLDLVEQIEIVRSFSQKVNLGNYQTADCFSSYKAIIKGNSTNEQIDEISKQLYEKARKEVETEIEEYFKATNEAF
jgi:hypothetical protein